MAGRKKSSKRIIKPRIKLSPCYFHESKMEPDYKKYELLQNYVTERARIVPKSRSGICSKHQRKLSTAIKRARHLGLLPFSASA